MSNKRQKRKKAQQDSFKIGDLVTIKGHSLKLMYNEKSISSLRLIPMDSSGNKISFKSLHPKEAYPTKYGFEIHKANEYAHDFFSALFNQTTNESIDHTQLVFYLESIFATSRSKHADESASFFNTVDKNNALNNTRMMCILFYQNNDRPFRFTIRPGYLIKYLNNEDT